VPALMAGKRVVPREKIVALVPIRTRVFCLATMVQTQKMQSMAFHPPLQTTISSKEVWIGKEPQFLNPLIALDTGYEFFLIQLAFTLNEISRRDYDYQTSTQ
jgi:hypothetical protein